MKVLFLVGPHASGKTYSTMEYLKKREDIKMIDTGPIMRKIHKEMDPESSISDWAKTLEKQYGKDITSQLISTEIGKIMLNSDCDKYIIIGFRKMDGIIYAAEHLNFNDFNILYVDGTREFLYNNYLNREKVKISFAKFENYLDDELKIGLGDIRRLALNSQGVDYYYRTSNNDNFGDILESYFSNKKIKKLIRGELFEK